MVTDNAGTSKGIQAVIGAVGAVAVDVAAAPPHDAVSWIRVVAVTVAALVAALSHPPRKRKQQGWPKGG